MLCSVDAIQETSVIIMEKVFLSSESMLLFSFFVGTFINISDDCHLDFTRGNLIIWSCSHVNQLVHCTLVLLLSLFFQAFK